jgi:Ca-activated chloride channel family protein
MRDHQRARGPARRAVPAELRSARGALLAALLLCAPLLVAWGVPGRVASAIKRGNVAYHKADYDQALREYAGIRDPGPAEQIVRFNSGDALYKKDNHKAAVEEYQRALGRGPEFDAQVHYNIGNAGFRMGKLDDAIASYKRALDLDPTDMWAKHNLEFALRQQRQQQEQHAPQAQQKQEQKEQREAQQGEAQQRPAPGQQQSAGSQRQEQPSAEQQSAQANQSRAGAKQPAQPAPRTLTPEEAVRLLRAAASDDRAIQKQVIRMQMEAVPESVPEKDW